MAPLAVSPFFTVVNGGTDGFVAGLAAGGADGLAADGATDGAAGGWRSEPADSSSSASSDFTLGSGVIDMLRHFGSGTATPYEVPVMKAAPVVGV